jgi:hypothetical protein
MLTAATAALLSGPAYAASTCDSSSTANNCLIDTTINAPLYTGTVDSTVKNATSTSGSFTIITSGGALTITTSPPTAPAITLNSGSTATPTIITVQSSTDVTYTGVDYAVGALMEEASVPTSDTSYGVAETWTGEFVNDGTVNLTGNNTKVVGILFAGGAVSDTGGVAITPTSPPMAILESLPASFRAAAAIRSRSSLKRARCSKCRARILTASN